MVFQKTVLASSLVASAAAWEKNFGKDQYDLMAAQATAHAFDCETRQNMLQDILQANPLDTATYPNALAADITTDALAKAFCETGGNAAADVNGAWCFYTAPTTTPVTWSGNANAGGNSDNRQEATCVAGNGLAGDAAAVKTGLENFFAYVGTPTVAIAGAGTAANIATADDGTGGAAAAVQAYMAPLAAAANGCNGQTNGDATCDFISSMATLTQACYTSSSKCKLDTSAIKASTQFQISDLTTTATTGEKAVLTAHLLAQTGNFLTWIDAAVNRKSGGVPTGYAGVGAPADATALAAQTAAAQPLCVSLGAKYTPGVVSPASAPTCVYEAGATTVSDAGLEEYLNYLCGNRGDAIRTETAAAYTTMATAVSSQTDTGADLMERKCENPYDVHPYIVASPTTDAAVKLLAARTKGMCTYVSAGTADTSGTQLSKDNNCVHNKATTATSDAPSAAAVSTAALAAGLLFVQ